MVKITVKKSPNEKTNYTLEYPVKYGRTGGNSIWVEREIIDMLYIWGYITRKGAWINLSDDFHKHLESNGFELPQKIQGENNLYKELELNPELISHLICHFKEMICEQ